MLHLTKYLLLFAFCKIAVASNDNPRDGILFNEIFNKYPDVEVKLVELKGQNVHSESEDLPGYNLVEPVNTPTIFWHGMGDTAHGSIEVERNALKKRYPNMSVFSIQIGNDPLEDAIAGYLVNANYQVSQACEAILKNKVIRQSGAFNAVGFSQGAQFMRALIQRCPLKQNGIRVKNFISLGGQHQGVYGLPNCDEMVFCDYIRNMIAYATYEASVQEHVVQAEYWHDPKREDEYKKKSVFLADINNELRVNKTYRSNLMALDNMLLIKFNEDDMVIPRESSHFGFYAPGQATKILNLQQSRLYLEDRLGLKKMYEDGRLQMIGVPGRHLQYKLSWFLDHIADVYLNN